MTIGIPPTKVIHRSYPGNATLARDKPGLPSLEVGDTRKLPVAVGIDEQEARLHYIINNFSFSTLVSAQDSSSSQAYS